LLIFLNRFDHSLRLDHLPLTTPLAAAAEPDPHGVGRFGVAGSAKLTQSLVTA
jgi:hypothetical protein